MQNVYPLLIDGYELGLVMGEKYFIITIFGQEFM